MKKDDRDEAWGWQRGKMDDREDEKGWQRWWKKQ